MAKRRRTHKQVEFHVDGYDGNPRIFRTFADACEFAVGKAAAHDGTINVDVVIWDRSGARWWSGSEGVAQYNEDPEASVFERIEVSANVVGRIA